jgi:hypothetical protein
MTKWMKESGLDLSGLDAGTREWLLSFAGGSPGVAQLAVSTGITEWHKTLSPMLADVDRGKFSLDLGATMAKLIEEWATARVEAPGAEHASKDAANKAAAKQMFRLIGEHYRTRLRAAAGKGGEERALAAIDLAVEAERQIDASCAGRVCDGQSGGAAGGGMNSGLAGLVRPGC